MKSKMSLRFVGKSRYLVAGGLQVPLITCWPAVLCRKLVEGMRCFTPPVKIGEASKVDDVLWFPTYLLFLFEELFKWPSCD